MDLAAYRALCAEPSGYLDFARFGPPTRAVVDRTAELTEAVARSDASTVDSVMRWDERARAAVARLCRGTAERVVLLPNTSLGLFHTAFALRGEVLVSSAEFPANTYPWTRAEQAGLLRPRWLRPADGRVTSAEVTAALTPEITAVSVSAVDFRTGHVADLPALRAAVGERLLVVDGIQAFGAVDLPWELADVLLVGGQKWLRAGWGTGFAVLSDRALAVQRPVLSGWTGADGHSLSDDELRPPRPTAAGWSITHLSPVAAAALTAALDLLAGVGVDTVEKAIAERVALLEDVVRGAGATVHQRPGNRAGILTWTLPGRSGDEVGQALVADGMAVTARPGHVRLSPHASTRPEVADRLRDTLRRLARTRPRA